MEYLENLGKEERDEYKELYYWIYENKKTRKIDENKYINPFELTLNKNNHSNLTNENVELLSSIIIDNRDLSMKCKIESIEEFNEEFVIRGSMYYVEKEFLDKYNRYKFLIEKNISLYKND